MASGLYLKRPENLPPLKLYGYKKITPLEQTEIINRVTRPTHSVLQARILTKKCAQAYSTDEQLQTLKTKSHNGEVGKSPAKQLDISEMNPATTESDLVAQKPTSAKSNKSNLSRSSLALFLESGDINSQFPQLSHKSDICSEPLRRDNAHHLVLPVCSCPKGFAILRDETKKWVEKREVEHLQRMTFSIEPCHHLISKKPLEWNLLKFVVRRLHETKTVSATARQKETGALLKRLSQQRQLSALGFITKWPLVNGVQHPVKASLYRPEYRASFFDSTGHFKVKDYFNRVAMTQKWDYQLAKISRPTTASKLKHRGHCPICEENPCDRTVLGVGLSEQNSYSSQANRSLKHQEVLIERLIKPTMASRGTTIVCPRASGYDESVHTDRNEDNTYLCGEAIVRRIAHSAKTLPLISGLERSSSLASITRRVYSEAILVFSGTHASKDEKRKVQRTKSSPKSTTFSLGKRRRDPRTLPPASTFLKWNSKLSLGEVLHE
ncbi:unnamed protein product [Calicophoron daubneyi]|uniref:Uncharacterized protein n=1 Tax=Calicophoron daubneyi TaxID=300641 RepID=A0AAV2T924_CALDB